MKRKRLSFVLVAMLAIAALGEDASGAGVPTGYSTNLMTKDGQTLSLTYGTAGYGGPGAASGGGAAEPTAHGCGGAGLGQWAGWPRGARH